LASARVERRIGGFEAAVIELGTLRPQTVFDGAKAVAIDQLSKGHGQKLVPARQSPL